MPRNINEFSKYKRKLTNVNKWGAICLALFLGINFYWIIYLFKEDCPIYEYFYMRGLIPPILTFFFCLSISILSLKQGKIKKERFAFNLVEEKLFANYKNTLRISDISNFTEIMETFDEHLKQRIIVNRISKVAHRIKDTHSSAKLDDILNSISDIDRDIVEASYAGIRFLAGVIPILGFLGTVFGISKAITTFTTILENARSFENVKPALNIATTNLGIAFDTTLLALFFSGFILLFMSVIQKQEDDLLSAVDEYCMEKFSSIQIISSDIIVLTKTVEASTVKMISAIKSTTDKIQSEIISVLKPISTINMENYIKTIVEILEANVIGLKDKLNDFYKNQQEPTQGLNNLITQIENLPKALKPLKKMGESFDGIENIGEVFDKFEKALIDLKPAIENLSKEMAEEINDRLMQLLRVNAAGHALHTKPDHDKEFIRKTNFDDVLADLKLK